MKEGTTTAMLHSGLTRSMDGAVRWKVVATFENVHDKTADGKTAYEKSCGVEFDGPLIPFGATKVTSQPI